MTLTGLALSGAAAQAKGHDAAQAAAGRHPGAGLASIQPPGVGHARPRAAIRAEGAPGAAAKGHARKSHAAQTTAKQRPAHRDSGAGRPIQSSPSQSSPVLASPLQASPVQSSPIQSPSVRAIPVQYRAPAAQQSPGDSGWTGENGVASFYGQYHHGRRTAGGTLFNQNALTAAHPWLPFGTRVRVTVGGSDRSVIVVVTDRLYSRKRVVDLSMAAARELGMLHQGLAKVSLTPT